MDVYEIYAKFGDAAPILCQQHEAIMQQHKTITRLEKEVDALHAQVEALNDKNARLRAAMSTALHWSEDISAGALSEFLEEALREGE